MSHDVEDGKKSLGPRGFKPRAIRPDGKEYSHDLQPARDALAALEAERDRYREALEQLTEAVRRHIADGGYDGTFEELAEVLAAVGGDPE